MEHNTSIKIIQLPEVIGATQLSRSTIYRLLGSGAFPQPLRLSERAIGWHQDEIDARLSSRQRTRESGRPLPKAYERLAA